MGGLGGGVHHYLLYVESILKNTLLKANLKNKKLW